MKKPLQITICIIILMLQSNCNKKFVDDNLDNVVYAQIMQEIIDSCTIVPPPPPNLNLGPKAIQDYKKQIEEVYNRKFLIAVYDTISAYNKSNFEKLVAQNNLNVKWNETDTTKSIIKINDYKVKHNVKLINATKLPSLYEFAKENKSWENYHELKNLYVAIGLKKIILNKNNSEGFLQIGVICGKLCGQGFDLWVKKENDKWKIIKIKPTWIS